GWGEKLTGGCPPPMLRKLRTSLPVATSSRRMMPLLLATANSLPSGDSAVALKNPPSRKRMVPRRASAPSGSGSPCASTRGVFFSGGAPRPSAAARTSETRRAERSSRRGCATRGASLVQRGQARRAGFVPARYPARGDDSRKKRRVLVRETHPFVRPVVVLLPTRHNAHRVCRPV